MHKYMTGHWSSRGRKTMHLKLLRSEIEQSKSSDLIQTRAAARVGNISIVYSHSLHVSEIGNNEISSHLHECNLGGQRPWASVGLCAASFWAAIHTKFRIQQLEFATFHSPMRRAVYSTQARLGASLTQLPWLCGAMPPADS